MTHAERVDAVVVGAGPNGLAAASRLGRAGRSVVVLEAQPRLGGGAVSQELTLPGFVTDTFSSVYPAAAASPVFARMPLHEHGLEWVHPEVAMAHPMPGGRAGALYRDLRRTAENLDDCHPGDGAAWAGPYLERFEALRATLLGGFPPVAGGARLLAALGIQGTLEFGRLLLTSADQLADDLFRGEHARAWLFGSSLHGDVGAHESGSRSRGPTSSCSGTPSGGRVHVAAPVA